MSKLKTKFKQVRLEPDIYDLLLKVQSKFPPKRSKEGIANNALEIGLRKMQEAETSYILT